MTERSQRRASRAQRLQAALRENLKRRKAQARGRSAADAGSAGREAAKPAMQADPEAKDESTDRN